MSGAPYNVVHRKFCDKIIYYFNFLEQYPVVYIVLKSISVLLADI